MVWGEIYHPRGWTSNEGASEFRNPNPRMNDEARMTNAEQMQAASIPCGRPSSFGFRHSSFIRGFGFRHFCLLLALLSCCDKPAPPATGPSTPTVASLVPAATDLIVGMGAGDRMVAISTYDKARKDVGHLPQAGDYQTVDWELLRSLHPSVLVTEMAPSRQPAGFKANAQEIGITPVNVTIENLNDIFSAMDQLGDAIEEPQLARAAREQMKARLEKVRTRCSAFGPVRTLIVIDPGATGAIGSGTYLDDLLKIAGGTNVVPAELGHWPMIDREKLLSLSPDAVLQLLPGASPQVRDQAKEVWKLMPDLPAVKTGRVYPITDDYALLPGWHVTDLAEQFADCLHGKKAGRE
jgi:iron complex transport system substrate-binding protein